MGDVSEEDSEGFVNLNIRVNREDLIEMCCISPKKVYKLTKKQFRDICQKMGNSEPYNGGDDYQNALTEAYNYVMGEINGKL